MDIKKKDLAGLLVFAMMCINGQTAVNSGNWTACNSWGFPNYITNTVSEGKAIANGITINANQTWSMGYLNLSGSGSVNMNPAITLDFAANTGAAKACASLNISWDVPVTPVSAVSTVNLPYQMTVNANSAGIPLSSMLVDSGIRFIFPFTGNYDVTMLDDYTPNSTSGDLRQRLLIYDSSNNLKYTMMEQSRSGITWGPMNVYYTNVNLNAGDYMVRTVNVYSGGATFTPYSPSRPGLIRFNPN